MRFIKAVVILFIAAAFAVSAYAEPKQRTYTQEEIKKMADTRAVVETKFGNIELKFFPEVAPGHVNNFIELAKKGFYDGTIFHRVIPGFMIQGGDPNSKSPDKSKHGIGGPGYSIKAEFEEGIPESQWEQMERTLVFNKYGVLPPSKGPLYRFPHKRGTLSMARAADPDSAGSQFFICVAAQPGLNGQYTVFGEVVSGMEAVDKIVSQPRDRRDNPNERIEMKVRIVEK